MSSESSEVRFRMEVIYIYRLARPTIKSNARQACNKIILPRGLSLNLYGEKVLLKSSSR